ncbi:MAG: bifunctional phosphoribosylaminoimidazolecarboxamide formyltransferase/IMP cyclohydrolase [Acidobacteria bacterium]|nr:bifunctional phosphoribosylaminoimidazolecarboxamide formyltransferase/IMP cyclohydrolase [Acidobacteriota bacterium]
MSQIERAILSVYDKQGIVELGRVLADQNVEILSTGGTASLLREKRIPVREVAEVTGTGEMLGGRVKTLHPAIHAGILARRDDPKQCAELKDHNIGRIDLVVVNLYPFAETAARADARVADLLEQIDIGGVTLIRAAAKNFPHVAAVVSPDDYARVIVELTEHGALSLPLRLELAQRAYALTARYDAWIAAALGQVEAGERGLSRRREAELPAHLVLSYEKAQPLRYGENPHQRAALYVEAGRTPAGVAGARQLQGKELSYNNLLDLEAAWELAQEFDEPAAVIIKHTNPCGVATARPEASGQAEAYAKAQACDPISTFGSVLGFNRPVTRATAEAMAKHFVEAIVAPGYEPEALARLAAKKNLRLLQISQSPEAGWPCTGWQMRAVSGGLLVQDRDRQRLDPKQVRVVTKRAPTKAEQRALLFAWKVVKHVKSNAIVYARRDQTVGIGAGQMSRVDSVKLGALKAVLPLAGTVLASDAFFPFPDGVEEAAKVGVTAIVQPGGSVRDPEVIVAANRLRLAMVFTGIRHFRH